MSVRPTSSSARAAPPWSPSRSNSVLNRSASWPTSSMLRCCWRSARRRRHATVSAGPLVTEPDRLIRDLARPIQLTGFDQRERQVRKSADADGILARSQVDRTAQQRPGSAKITCPQSATAAGNEQLGGPPRQRLALFGRSKLAAIQVRLLEVEGEDLLVLGASLAGPLLEPGGETLVELGPCLLRHRRRRRRRESGCGGSERRLAEKSTVAPKNSFRTSAAGAPAPRPRSLGRERPPRPDERPCPRPRRARSRSRSACRDGRAGRPAAPGSWAEP